MPLGRRERRASLDGRRNSMPLSLRPQTRRSRGLTEQLSVIDWSRLQTLYPSRARSPDPGGSCSPASTTSELSIDPGGLTHKVVLLGDSGVGKTTLARVFGGLKESFSSDLEHAEDRYERTLTVDEEEVTLVVYDIWEQEGASDWVQENCLELGDAYIIAFSVTDRVSFQRADELRAKLQATRPSQDIPIILVGNKTDLVRSREVTVEDARSRAASVDCKYIETSAALRHNTRELFEGVVRQLRLRLSGRGGRGGGRRESLTERAKRFLRSLVGGNYRGIFRQRSKSCHDLSVL